MLFNSIEFLIYFLPPAVFVTWLARRWSRRLAKLSVIVFSLIFYGYSDARHIPFLLLSFAFNYFIGESIIRARRAQRSGLVSGLVIAGVCVDLGLLIYFKYLSFVVQNIDHIAGAHFTVARTALPLAISFFTFQEIAYVVDAAREETSSIKPLDFGVMFAFFPKLISGPIVRFHELAPQLESRRGVRAIARDVMVGLVIFSIGLFKKSVFADNVSPFVDAAFTQVHAHHGLTPATAWLASLGYAIQLYFDFSGYSDMAIGLGRIFGLKLPLNFHSPYRAIDIIEYWRRWHITLQRFVLSYIFQPMALGLTRVSAQWNLQGWLAFVAQSGLPIFVTFVLLGVWHGAGWTFALFGVMHGVYLSLNEAWREHQKRTRRRLRRAGREPAEPIPGRRIVAHGGMLLAVVVADVMFRAPAVSDAVSIWGSLCGLTPAGGTAGPTPSLLFIVIFLAAGVTIFLLPNTQQIMARFDPAVNWRAWRDVGQPPVRWQWKPNMSGVLFAGAALFLGFVFMQAGHTSFVYFNF
jgi:alginate O-acetyltransferase complex protein AlgI